MNIHFIELSDSEKKIVLGMMSVCMCDLWALLKHATRQSKEFSVRKIQFWMFTYVFVCISDVHRKINSDQKFGLYLRFKPV